MIVDTAEHIGEPGFGIDVVELGGCDERIDRGSPLAAAIGAAEGPVATAEELTKASVSIGPITCISSRTTGTPTRVAW